jgi:hypothetical protein
MVPDAAAPGDSKTGLIKRLSDIGNHDIRFRKSNLNSTPAPFYRSASTSLPLSAMAKFADSNPICPRDPEHAR